MFHDLHLIRNKLKRWHVCLFKFSCFGKIKSIDETSEFTIIQSSFLFANITNLEHKMTKLTSSIGICFVFSNLNEINKTCWTSIKIPFAPSKIYIHMQVIWYVVQSNRWMWEIDWLKKSFIALLHCSEKKTYENEFRVRWTL